MQGDILKKKIKLLCAHQFLEDYLLEYVRYCVIVLHHTEMVHSYTNPHSLRSRCICCVLETTVIQFYQRISQWNKTNFSVVNTISSVFCFISELLCNKM